MLKLVTPDADPAAPAGAAAGATDPRYWAFLSYSHHDKAIAKRLQKQLETYRVPRRLVGRTTSHGTVPPRLAPVFRDRDELHAGADLKASVQDALSRSRWLIVVCTPDAARSPWVNREIIEFKKLHGERRVLALIAHGEPFASDKPGREAEECFPPALRRALNEQGLPEGEPLEPIAADMRREGDGPHRAMLKLMAGMLGVAFDDLVRRDVQRRVRWLTAIASASLVGVVVFAFMAVLAVQSRNEAQHQRQQAEGLIEFMLGDLRKKLEPVGRLEVLDSVGEKALAYYGAQESSTLDATALGHRSRAMHLIGEIRDLRGQPAESQKAFEQAAETTAQLLAKSPNDGQRIFDHSQSVFWVGYAAWKRADGKTAEAKFQEYLDLSRRLTRMDPANLDWLAEVAFAHGNMGAVQLGTNRAREALASLRAGNEILRQLSPKRPELAFELANNHGWQADAHEMLGDYRMALAEQRRRYELFRAMPDLEKNRGAQQGVLGALHSISLEELALGELEAAGTHAGAALKMAEDLIAADPRNLLWRSHACSVQLRLVEIALLRGAREEARTSFAKAARCVDSYNEAGTRGLRDSMLLKTRVLTYDAALASPQRAPALAAEIEEFLRVSTPKVTPETPDHVKLSVELAQLALALGTLQARDGASRAVSAWAQAVTLLAPFEGMQDARILLPLARARLEQGDLAAAQALLTRIQRTSYRHPAQAELANRLQSARGGGGSHEKQGSRS